MRYARIFLVNPPYSGSRVKVVFSSGLGYIAEALKISGLEYDVLDMSLGYSYRHLRKRIKDFCPDLIGISMITYKYKETCSIIKNIKKDFPKIKIAVGGPHVSLFRERVLRDCPQIDYGIVLEGEETIEDLCKGEPLDSIKGLIFMRGDKVIYNGDRPFIKDLDNVFFPKYDKFELEKSFNREMSALPIVSSRGCPFECVYCPVKCSIGEVFRVRSPENIMEELTYWYERGYRRFMFADDNFTLIKDRVYKLCDEIKKSNFKNVKFICDNGVRVDSLDRELLELMKEVGFYRIALGVEAGNDRILSNLKKRADIATVKKVISEACDLGYEVDLFFLVGSPGETWADLEDSFDIALNYPIGTAFFYNIIPFPHTELFVWIEQNARFIKNYDEYLSNYPILDNEPVFETNEMPFKIRKKALARAFTIMRMTMRKSWERRLSKLGILGRLYAFIYSTKFVQDAVMRNRFFKGLIYKLAYRFVSY